MAASGSKLKKRRGAEKHDIQDEQASLSDEIAAFEDFRREVLPMLRADLKKGLSHKELRTKYMALLEARKISIGLASLQESVAVTAIKDIQDREEGRAMEHKKVTHKYEDLPDQELDAILKSEAADLKDIILN